MLLSVDPGCRGCGCALFRSGELVAAAYVVNPQKRGLGLDAASLMASRVLSWAHELSLVGSLAIEVPKVYEAKFQKGDQNDLIALSLVAGAIAGKVGLHSVITYYPRDWKGTADADRVVIPLIQSRITETERTCVQLPAADLAHNVWDGIGVGLKALGRLEPRRVFAKEKT